MDALIGLIRGVKAHFGFSKAVSDRGRRLYVLASITVFYSRGARQTFQSSIAIARKVPHSKTRSKCTDAAMDRTCCASI